MPTLAVVAGELDAYGTKLHDVYEYADSVR